jgi:formylglycine-generating enzyme required for sulfatase activity/serine/threonine protein kinase
MDRQNKYQDFRQSDIDSLAVVWQKNERLLLPTGAAFLISEVLQQTVYVVSDQQIADTNQFAQGERAEGRAALSLQDERRIIKIAAGPHYPELPADLQQLAKQSFRQESDLLESLYLAGVNVPRVFNVLDADALLSADQPNKRRPCPPLILMEFIAGSKITDVVSASALKDRAQQLQQLWPALISAVESLEQKEVLHRDLKPDNMVFRQQKIVLLDFEKASSKTFTNSQKAQTPFSAPEVRQGGQSASSDHYSLAAISFKLLTKQDPDLHNRANLPEVFAPMAAFWQQALAEQPTERFVNLAALDTTFQQALVLFLKALNPTQEAEALKQLLTERLQQSEQTLAVQQQQVSTLSAQTAALSQWLAEKQPQHGNELAAFALQWAHYLQQVAALPLALASVQQVMYQQQQNLAHPLPDDDSARQWLAARAQDPDLAVQQAQLTEQITECTAPTLYQTLTESLTLPEFMPLQTQLTLCGQQQQALTTQLANNQSASLLFGHTLDALGKQAELYQHQLERLQQLAAEAWRLQSVDDLKRYLEQQVRIWQQWRQLQSDINRLHNELAKERFELPKTGAIAPSANWPLRLGAVAVLAALGYVAWPTIQSSMQPTRAELVSALVRGEASEVQLIANKPWEAGYYQFTVGTSRCEPRGIAEQTITFGCLVNESGNLTYQLKNSEGALQQGMLKVSAQSHLLNLNVTPANATVQLNQQQVKAGARLAEGEYNVSVTAEGYQPLNQTIQFTGQPLQLSLEPLTASFTVKSQTPDVQLQLKGATKNQRLNAGQSISLPLGDYELTASAKHFQSQTQKVSLTSNQQLSINLEPMRYSLNLNITPANATVFLDDVKATQPLQLLAGEYQLRVEAIGYQPYSEVLSVDKNSRKTLSLNPILKPAAPALVATQVATTPAAAANQVPFIHGWSAEQVKSLQQQAAKAVGKPVFFQEPLLNGQGFGPKMSVVPAGSFEMGCSERDTSCPDNETPGKHKVTHAKHFAVSQYEITFDDWALCVSQGGCQSNKTPEHRGWGQGQRPVINVSWHDAKEYVAWLSKATGKRYRLLTESEWEYTARAGSAARFAQFGQCIDTQQANYNGNYAVGGCPQSKTSKYLAKTQLVGQYPANSLGLYDALGNVLEWTADCYQSSLTAIPTNGTAVGNGNCQTAVLRGGSWDYEPRGLRVSDRNIYAPVVWNYFIGFRVAQDLF